MKAYYILSSRKELVKRIENITGEKSKYLGAPSMAYQIGDFTVARDGAIEGEEKAVDDLINRLEAEDAALSISLPNIPDTAMANLVTMISAKQDLLKQALKTDDLSIVQEGDKITFPWFREATPDEINAYMVLLTRMVEVCKARKRITMKVRETDNPKYSFRCFLLGLGLIGDEYKGARKVLLKNLDGSSAFKSGLRREVAE